MSIWGSNKDLYYNGIKIFKVLATQVRSLLLTVGLFDFVETRWWKLSRDRTQNYVQVWCDDFTPGGLGEDKVNAPKWKTKDVTLSRPLLRVTDFVNHSNLSTGICPAVRWDHTEGREGGSSYWLTLKSVKTAERLYQGRKDMVIFTVFVLI